MFDKAAKSMKREGELNQTAKKSKKNHGLNTEIPRIISYAKDPSYVFVEKPLIKADEPLDYKPIYFLRAHSKNNDTADVQTQIWQCVFEPDPASPSKQLDIVATCGGNSVCFIDVKTGQVVLKYNKNSAKVSVTENLYALAWSSLPLEDIGIKRMNILAAAGGKSTVVLIHPEEGCCYQTFRTVPNKNAATVNSLLFHPKKASWLFCGHEDGHIQIWDVGIPELPSYECTPTCLTTIPAVAGDTFNLVFSRTHDLLFAGCDNGLYAWHIDFEKVKNNHRLDRTQFILPPIKNHENERTVDSITLIRDDILATKCALHGCIYIFRISTTFQNKKYIETEKQYEVTLNNDCLVKLIWSDTDNYYMNMGVDSQSCTLVCGDDKGKLWVYDLHSLITGEIKSPLTMNKAIKPITASLLLEWPELEDQEVEKARKLRLDTYDIVVDKCTVSDGGQHIVAVTSNNMVCIWRRICSEDEEKDTNANTDSSD